MHDINLTTKFVNHLATALDVPEEVHAALLNKYDTVDRRNQELFTICIHFFLAVLKQEAPMDIDEFEKYIQSLDTGAKYRIFDDIIVYATLVNTGVFE